ncbi:MAG: glycosyltransferase [Cyanobacteriota bacterium]|nr:glycosyltransferase [Cyanobacteriota bacterium]
MEIKADFLFGHQKLGKSLLELHQWEEAEECFRKVLSLAPDYHWAHYSLGEALVGQERWEEAVPSFEKAIELKPDLMFAYQKLGDVLLKQQTWEKAEEAFRKAIELKSDFCWSHYGLGEALAGKEEWDEAVIAYRNAVELKPGLALVYSKLGNCLLKRGDLEEAALVYEQANKLEPNLVVIDKELNDYEKSKTVDEEEYELDETSDRAFQVAQTLGSFNRKNLRGSVNQNALQNNDLSQEETVILFFPDYRKTNPYQVLFYSQVPESYCVDAGTIDEAIELLQKTENHKRIIFHLHWTSFVLAGAKTQEQANQLRKDFIDQLFWFAQKGGSIVWTVHNTLPHNCQYPKTEIELRTGIVSLASKVHIHSEKSLSEIEEFFTIPREKLQVIHHGNYVDVYPNYISALQAREQFCFSQTDLVFLFLGQIRPYKGLDELIAAFVEVHKSIPNSYLLIAGNPVYPLKKGDLTERTKVFSHIKVIEKSIPDDELQWFFNAADAVVLPYRQILTSGSAINALSFNRPVIAPDVGMIQEIVIEGYNGFTYKLGDGKSLVRAMLKMAELMKDRKEKEKVYSQCLESVTNLTWSNHSNILFQNLDLTIEDEDITIETETVNCQIWNPYRLVENVSKARVAIIILNYKSVEDTVNLVKSLEKSSYRHFQIIIVDNKSPNLNFQELAILFQKYAVIQTPKNLGYAGGNNVAIQYVKDMGVDFIWILNPDTAVKSDTLEKLILATETSTEIDIYGSVICWTHRPETVWFGGGKVKITETQFQTYHMYDGQNKSVIPDRIYEVDYVTGASIFCRSSLFEEVGLIPEKYFLYFEETDWCLRARERGKKIAVVPSSQLYHSKKSQAGVLPTKAYFYYYIRAAVLFMLKYVTESDRSLIQNSIQEKFIKPWLEKIEKNSATQLAYFTALAQQALEDGLSGITGPVDLMRVLEKGLPAPNKFESPLQGNLEIVNEKEISGWVWNQSQPLERFEVTVKIDGNVRAVVLADRYLETLEQRGYGDGKYGFELKTPYVLLDSHPHTLEVFVEEIQLPSSNPKKIELSPRPPKYKGRIDGIDNRQLKGWALDLNNPGKTVTVEVLDEAKVILEAECNLERPDLLKAGYQSGQAGFLIPIPVAYCDGSAHTLKLKVKDTDEVLCSRSVKMSATKYPVLSVSSIEAMFCWLYHHREVSMVHPSNRDSMYLKQIELWGDHLAKGFMDREQNYLVSIVMPAYNRASTIKESIKSVMGQTYRNWELIIADDCSEDNTIAVVRDSIDQYYANQISIIPLGENGGVSKARNAALKKAKGNIVAYLDSDNTWDSNFLLIMVNTLIDHPWAKVAYCGDRILQHYPGNTTLPSGREISTIRLGPFNKSLIENRNYIDLNVFVHWRELYDRLGGFREDMRRLVDWELIVRYTDFASPKFVPAVLVNYHMGLCDNQITRVENYDDNLIKIKETVENLGYFKSESEVNKTQDVEQDRANLPKSANIIINACHSELNTLKLCLQAVLENTDTKVVKIVLYLERQNIIAIEKLLNFIGVEENLIELRYSDGGKIAEIIEDASKHLSEKSGMVFLSSHAVVSAGWLSSLIAPTHLRDDVAVVMSREIRNKNDLLANNIVPYASKLLEIDTALDALTDIIVNPSLDEEKKLIEISYFKFFCVYFTNRALNYLDLTSLTSLADKEWSFYISNYIKNIQKQKNVYTPLCKVFYSNFARSITK